MEAVAQLSFASSQLNSASLSTKILQAPMEAAALLSSASSQLNSASTRRFVIARDEWKQQQQQPSLISSIGHAEQTRPVFVSLPNLADCPEGCLDQVAESKERWRWPLTRRSLIALPLAATTLWVSPSQASITVENRAPSGNPLLRSLGIGERDIYYPRFFQGLWNCYSTLIAVETPQGEAKVDSKNVEQAKERLGYTTTYQARFVPFEGYVVCDRLFTTVSLVESIIGKKTIEHGSWSPRQPNRLELILKGGLKVENTVTKRSAGMFSPNEFESAEFSKQVFDNSLIADGPPTVKASQNLTRYQWDNSADEVNKIEAIQKVSMYSVPKEGQDFEGMEMFNTTEPVTIYKYRVTFERQTP